MLLACSGEEISADQFFGNISVMFLSCRRSYLLFFFSLGSDFCRTRRIQRCRTEPFEQCSGTVLAQREVENRRSSLVLVPPLRAGIFKALGVYRPMLVLRLVCAARDCEACALRNIGSMSPARLSLGMVASLQSPLPFRPASYCRSRW